MRVHVRVRVRVCVCVCVCVCVKVPRALTYVPFPLASYLSLGQLI